MTIDAHVHITRPEIIANELEYGKNESYFDLLSSNPKNKYVTSNDVIARMDKEGIDRAIVFGFAFKSNELCRWVNDFTIETVKRFPEKLIGYAVVNPLSSEAEQELERCRQAGLKGVGEIYPTGQGFDPSDKGQMAALCNFCHKHRWPLMVHLNEPVGHDYPGKTADSIKQGAALATNFPNVRFIYAHLGGGLCFYELMPELRESLKNVYYDTAAQPFLYSANVYTTLKAIGILPKILFGSDYPLLSISKYRREIESIRLEPVDREAVMGRNAKNLLSL